MAFENSRWVAPEDQFAIRVTTNHQELRGWLKNSVVVQPGTRAYVVQEGEYLGEIPAGEYTLKSFEEKLAFWRKGQTDIILTRSDDVTTRVTCNVPNADGLFTQVSVHVAIQVDDVSQFLDRILGPRNALSLEDLTGRIVPLVTDDVRAAVGSRTIEELQDPAISSAISEHVHSSLNLRLKRYGFSFVEVQTADVAQRGLDEHLQEVGTQKLESMRYEAATGKMERDLEGMKARIDVRRQLRDAVSSDKMDNIQTREEMSDFLLEINKGKILRKEELDQLVEGFEERKEDRQDLRNHLVSLLELSREQEVDELRDQTAHQMKVRALTSERELAELAGESANQEWRRELQQELEATEHRNQLRQRDADAKWAGIREQNRQRREDSWDKIVHEQRMETLRSDVEVAEAERKSRVAILEKELAVRLEAQQLEMEKRRKEWEMEVADRESTSQMDRLQKVQEMNLQMQERQQKMQVDMEELKSDKSHRREMERVQAMGQLGTEALIATANSDNASMLADLKKHESTEQSKRHEAEISNQTELNDERLQMYEKMNEAERSKADAIAQAYKEAMQSQQSTVQQAISGIAQASTSQTPAMPAPPPVPPMPTAETWHVSLGGQQSPPLQLAQVHQYIASGQVDAATMVWKTGLPQWLPASQVPELASYLASGPSAPPPLAGGPPGPPPS